MRRDEHIHTSHHVRQILLNCAKVRKAHISDDLFCIACNDTHTTVCLHCVGASVTLSYRSTGDTMSSEITSIKGLLNFLDLCVL